MNRAETFWNASASNYDKTEQRFSYIHEKSREYCKKHLAPTDVVLDYGCGTGTTSCDVAHLVHDIQGIDISAEMIKLAREKASRRGIENVRFERKDLFDEGYAGASFDKILVFNVLHTVPEPEKAVRRIHELLRPGGLVVTVTPCFRDEASFLGRMQLLLVRVLCMIRVIPIPIRSVGASDLDRLFTEVGGFETVESETIFQGTSSYFKVARRL